MSNGRRPYAQLRFAKSGRLRFVGHLDLMRAIDRAVRRARLPVSYTEGYNRHARISLSPPPPAGTTSRAELCVIDLEHKVPLDVLKSKLNEQLPEDLQIIGGTTGFRGSRSPLADLSRMVYEAELRLNAVEIADLQTPINTILEKDSIEVDRSSNRKQKVVDIRPGIEDLKLRPANQPILVMVLRILPGPTPKPREIVRVIDQHLQGGADGTIEISHLTRTDLS